MTVQEKKQRKNILRKLIRDIHMPSFCDEEGRCDALDVCIAIEEGECSCCNINRIVKAFNEGIEFQKQRSPWIKVKDDLPCNHEELIYNEEETIQVIATNKRGNIWIDYMVCEDGKWRWRNSEPDFWMIIPGIGD